MAAHSCWTARLDRLRVVLRFHASRAILRRAHKGKLYRGASAAPAALRNARRGGERHGLESSIARGRAGLGARVRRRSAQPAAWWRRCSTPRGSSAAATPVPLDARHGAAGEGRAAHRRQRARALKLAEGSAVKLGENAQFVHRARRGPRRLPRGALGRSRARSASPPTPARKAEKRDIAIKVKNVTAGIRGTDLWGKSTDERDLVVPDRGQDQRGLAEGHPTVTLDKPLDFYQSRATARPGVREGGPGAARGLGARDRDGATDGAGGDAPAGAGAWWRPRSPDRDEARALNAGPARRAAIPPRSRTASAGRSRCWSPGLAGEAEARALVATLRERPGVAAPAVRGRCADRAELPRAAPLSSL